GSANADIDVGELAEPKLLFLEHLVLEHQIAGAVRSGDGNRPGDTAPGRQVARQIKTLVGAPTGHVGIAPSGVGEVHPQPDPSAAGRRPGLVAVVGDGDGVVLRLTRCPAGSTLFPYTTLFRSGSANADIDVGELAEPELLFLEHLVLEHQIAGA